MMEEHGGEFRVGDMKVVVLSNRIIIGTEYYENLMAIRVTDIQPLTEALRLAGEYISKKDSERYEAQERKVAEAWSKRTEEDARHAAKD